jgi:DNA-binding NarL/FixJ family response regulator
LIRIVLTIPGSALRAGLHAILESGPAFQVIHAGQQPGSLETADVWVVTESILPEDIRRSVRVAQADVALLVLGKGTGILHRGDLPVRAWGILPVDATVEELIAAVQALHAGLVVASPEWMATALTQRPGPAADLDALVEPLTERETEVLQLLAQGLSNKQIAVRLFISEHTVKFHVSSIYGKLGATNRAEAVRLGVQRGFVML